MNPADSAPGAVKPRRVIGALGLLVGICALATPLLPGSFAFLALGAVILAMGLLENLSGFAVGHPRASTSWFRRGGTSIVTGLLLMALPRLAFAALAGLLGLSWIFSGVSTVVQAIRGRGQGDWIWLLFDGCVNIVLGAAIALQWPIAGIASIGIYVGLHYVSAAWTIVAGTPDAGAATVDGHPDSTIGLPPHPHLTQLRETLASELAVSARSDRYWVCMFVLTFFAIHVARMEVGWSLVDFCSPAGAVIGDVLVAILLAYGLVAPMSVAWRTSTRRLERWAWSWYLARLDREKRTWGIAALVHRWLTQRMRGAVRREQTRGSASAALGWGLQRGLPLAGILLAVAPLWGVSWVFNTETWVTGAWELWAEQHTDAWRTQMVQAVRAEHGAAGAAADFLRITPAGVDGAGDFAFVVIGDTGEGDASQHILRDQLLLVGQKPDVRFLVVSSDVIYPSGAMHDYEPKFYLPFKGFHKPIYAVPGNHDWYDALDAFTANFLEPKAARTALRARREADLGLTATTESRIDAMIAEATRWRKEYQVRAALQRAPYFEMHADRFSLVVVDTGIQRRIDDDQMRWLEDALTRARGNFTMAILGHPLYAAGHYQGEADPNFARIHDLLKKHSVDVVMAGDTHDFEFYKEPYERDGKARSMYHFVNGGGGAYLSIGTALSWPKHPPVKECGFYPRADALTASLDANTPTWKRPIWQWVKHLHAWPSTPETLAAAFTYDRAPFFQSFMEVRVERSADLVRFWLYGTNGRLRWRDLHVQDERVPDGRATGDFVEFTFPLRAPGR